MLFRNVGYIFNTVAEKEYHLGVRMKAKSLFYIEAFAVRIGKNKTFHIYINPFLKNEYNANSRTEVLYEI